jgi:hypothetical protein
VSVVAASGQTPVAGVTVTIENPGTGFSATATTDDFGRARFSGLTTSGAYVVKAEAGPATRAVASEPIQLRSSFARSVTLIAPARAVEEIVVTGRREVTQINMVNAEVSSTLSEQELRTLPIEGRDIARTLFRLPNVTQATGFYPEAPNVAINGANSLFTNYMIDGLDNNENFLGGQKFPIPVGATQAITVLANTYSAEFGRTANGIVNITSASGSNDLDGEVFFVHRPGDLLAGKTPFNTTDLSGNAVRDDFKRYQGGFAVRGPIIRDKTFFAANVEYTRDDKENRLVVPELAIDTPIGGTNTFWLSSLRLDHNWSDAWSSMLRVSIGRVFIERPGGGIDGGVTFPSAGDSQDRLSTLVAFTTTYTGERLTYEGAIQYSRFRWNYGAPASGPGPRVTVQAPSGQPIAFLGNNGFVFDEIENTVQTKHKLTFDEGRHTLKAGVDFLAADFSLRGGGNINGNYTVRLTAPQLAALRASGRGVGLTPNDIPRDVQVIDYGVELQPSTFGKPQYLVGLYIEDQIAVTPRLNVTAGVRWDYDSLSKGGAKRGEWDNIAPRVSANYALTERSAVRAGLGLFYEKIPYAVFSDALQQNSTSAAYRGQLQQLIARGILPADTDLNRVTFDGNLTVSPPCTVYLACPTPGQSQNLRVTASASERRILNPAGYRNPYALQATVGYQWQFNDTLLFYADGIYSRGRRLFRLVDLNAPSVYVFNGRVRTEAEANATRPVAPVPGGARSIVVSDSGGRSRYTALNLTLVKDKGDDPYAFRASYTLSQLKNDTDDINFRAQDSNAFDAEWGPSLNDRTHVFSGIATLYATEALSFSIAALVQSGQPINYVPDARVYGTTDLNGQGQSYSEGYTGNAYRAPGSTRNSGRLPWSSTFDVGVQYRLPVPGGDFEVRLDVFNVFNASNTSGYAVNFTQSNQIQIGGAPFIQRSASPPRTLQLSGRYLF